MEEVSVVVTMEPLLTLNQDQLRLVTARTGIALMIAGTLWTSLAIIHPSTYLGCDTFLYPPTLPQVENVVASSLSISSSTSLLSCGTMGEEDSVDNSNTTSIMVHPLHSHLML